MIVIVGLVGVVIGVIGGLVILAPLQLRNVLSHVTEIRWLWVIAITRVICGAGLLYAAAATCSPELVSVFGVILVADGIMVPILGPPGIRRMVDWWLRISDMWVRLWGVVATAIGGVLIWSALC